MKDTVIKICGITNLELAEFCIDQNANYLGFVFYKHSPRNIMNENISETLEKIKNKVNLVAVTKDPTVSIIEKISNLPFKFIQVHGGVLPDKLAEIKNTTGMRVIKAFNISSSADLNDVNEYQDIADFYLFDSKSSGSGEVFDWCILGDKQINKDFFLSGGLNPDNISKAIEKTGTKYIDVSSGVEKREGIKDKKLIEQFILNARM